MVDQTKSMFFGSQKRTKSVVAAELAALAAFRVLKQGDRVGGIVFADNGIDHLAAQSATDEISCVFLEKVVKRNLELGSSKPTKFEDTLRDVTLKIKNIVTHDFLIVLISDFHRYSPKVLKFITQLSQHNDVILAQVTDPMEYDIPDVKFVAGDDKNTDIGRRKHQKT